MKSPTEIHEKRCCVAGRISSDRDLMARNSWRPTPKELAEISVARMWPQRSAFLPMSSKKSELKSGRAMRKTRFDEFVIYRLNRLASSTEAERRER